MHGHSRTHQRLFPASFAAAVLSFGWLSLVLKGVLLPRCLPALWPVLSLLPLRFPVEGSRSFSLLSLAPQAPTLDDASENVSLSAWGHRNRRWMSIDGKRVMPSCVSDTRSASHMRHTFTPVSAQHRGRQVLGSIIAVQQRGCIHPGTCRL